MNSTLKEVSKLHKDLNKKKTIETDIDFPESESESDRESIKHDYGKTELLNKKETLLYIFTRYEKLQTICNEYKCKNYVLKYQIKTQEEKNYCRKLEYSNIILDNKELREKLSKLNYYVYILYLTNTIGILFGIFCYYYKFR